MTRPTGTIQLFTSVAALVGTPALMIGGFVMFGTAAAVRFGILDFDSDYTEGAITAIILLGLILLWPVPAAHRRALLLLWLLRIGVALGAMLPYEAYYGLDATMYYLNGGALNDPLSWFEFGAGSRNVIALVGLLAQITESYSAQKVIFSYVGLISVYIFYRAATDCLRQEKIILLYVLGVFPSLLFWSSILGKDPIVLFGIAIYCYGVTGLIIRQKISMLGFVVIGLLIAASIRIWLGVIFVAPLIVTYVMSGRSSIVTKLIFLLVAIPGFLFTLQGFSENFSLETTEDLVARTDQISTSWAYGGSAQQIEGGFDSIPSMIAFMPVGAFTALFRPLPFEVLNIFGLLAGFENGFILVLFIMGLSRRGFGVFRQPILLWALTTLLVWGAVYGFASYQNLGSAFRFRVQIVPILLLLSIYLSFGHRLEPRRFQRPGTPKQNAPPEEPRPLTAGAVE